MIVWYCMIEKSGDICWWRWVLFYCHISCLLGTDKLVNIQKKQSARLRGPASICPKAVLAHAPQQKKEPYRLPQVHTQEEVSHTDRVKVRNHTKETWACKYEHEKKKKKKKKNRVGSGKICCQMIEDVENTLHDLEAIYLISSIAETNQDIQNKAKRSAMLNV